MLKMYVIYISLQNKDWTNFTSILKSIRNDGFFFKIKHNEEADESVSRVEEEEER